MSFMIGEKLIHAVLISGLSTIKADLDTYIPHVFETEIYNADYQGKIKSFLGAKKITIKRGNPLDAARFPGWFVFPGTNQAMEQWVGNYISDDEVSSGQISENAGVLEKNYIKLLTASDNADVTVFLDAIARYILYSGMDALAEDYSLSDFQISANEIDPITQYLPENHYYRVSAITFNALDSWEAVHPVIGDVTVSMEMTE